MSSHYVQDTSFLNVSATLFSDGDYSDAGPSTPGSYYDSCSDHDYQTQPHVSFYDDVVSIAPHEVYTFDYVESTAFHHTFPQKTEAEPASLHPCSASRQASIIRRRKPANYKCEECQHTFTTPYNLQNHRKIHSQVKDQRCEYCDKAFRTRSTLVRHQKKNQKCKRMQPRQARSTY